MTFDLPCPPQYTNDTAYEIKLVYNFGANEQCKGLTPCEP